MAPSRKRLQRTLWIAGGATGCRIAELARWLPHPEALPLGKAFYEFGIGLSDVFFPTTATVSLLSVMGDGCSAEIAVGGGGGVDDLLTVLVAQRTLIEAEDQLAPVGLARLSASIVLFKARGGGGWR